MRFNILLHVCVLLGFSSSLVAQQTSPADIEGRLGWLAEGGEKDLSIVYDTLDQLLTEAQQTGDYRSQVNVLILFSSTALKRTKDFELASEYLEKIRELAIEHENDPWVLARYHNGLGVLYFTEGVDRSRAYREFRKSQEIIRANNLEDDPSLLNNFALALMNGGEVDESLKIFKEAIRKHNQSGKKNNSFIFNNLLNQGVNFIYLEMQDSAFTYFNEALSFSTRTEAVNDDFEARVYMGVYQQELGDYVLAIETLKDAELFIDRTSGYNLKVLLYEALSICEASLGNYKSAFEAMQNLQHYKDSLDFKGYNEQALKFDYRRELDSIQYNQELVNIKTKAEKEKLNSRIFILILSLLLIAGIFTFILFRINKRNQLNFVLAENERLEKERIKREKELELLKKNQEIVSKDIELGVRNYEMTNLKKILQEHLDKSNDPNFSELRIFLNQVKNSEKKVAQLDLLNTILSVNTSDFLKNLKQRHPQLTEDELRLLSLIRLNLSSEELMLVFNISKASLNTKRYRVRKKIKLETSESLEGYIMTL